MCTILFCSAALLFSALPPDLGSDPRLNQDFVGRIVAITELANGPASKAEKDAQGEIAIESAIQSLPRAEFIRQCGLLLGALHRDPRLQFPPTLIGAFFSRMHVTHQETIAAFVPLWADGDPPLRDATLDGLNGATYTRDGDAFYGHADFSVMIELLTACATSDIACQEMYIDCMFTLSPGTAWETLLKRDRLEAAVLEARKESMAPLVLSYHRSYPQFLSEDELKAGKEILTTLAGEDDRWSHLLAAELYLQAPKLRTDSAAAKLRQWDDPLVRRRLDAVEAESK